jgi:LAO/AO transport system kinase
MQDHATDSGVYIRSMATRGHLGGLALATPLAARVLDAAGKPWVLIETVGVGQVEVEIAGAADTTVVVVNPGWGDGVQANKAGLMEIADVFVVNKADRDGVAETVRDLEMMLDLGSEREWRPPVVQTVATRDEGIEDLWTRVTEHRAFQERTSQLARRREDRLRDELRDIVMMRLRDQLASTLSGDRFEKLVAQVAARELDPYAAARELLD